MGQSMTLRRKVMPNGLEVHNLYFSQRYIAGSGKNSWKVSVGSIYHADEYAYEPQYINEIDNAFVFPPKTASDSSSTSISFSIWGERIIAIADQDEYFEFSSLCTNDQYWTQQPQNSYSDYCSSCPSSYYSEYQVSLSPQGTRCYQCSDLDESLKSDKLAQFLLNTNSPTCIEQKNKLPPP